ncbi:CpsB/CapC family capsule biosynthesis tyrosine phosphatase, partial [Parageobacillus toebii]|uniref:CpsB/CapC family capsule biosynthesis tyrosine phosphatase n=2 Tax=Parageobacillus TaxID=1906945 RepID=UPI0035B51333
MIDIHSHILPGVDDGAQTIDDAIAMARAAVKEGITTIIATPHHKNGSYDNPKQSIIT